MDSSACVLDPWAVWLSSKAYVTLVFIVLWTVNWTLSSKSIQSFFIERNLQLCCLLSSSLFQAEMHCLKMNRMIVLWGHGRGTVTGPIKLCCLKHFQCIRDTMKPLSALGIKHIKHCLYGLLPLLVEVFVIIVHSSEASQILNKCCVLAVWIDWKLFTQVHEPSRRWACFLCF